MNDQGVNFPICEFFYGKFHIFVNKLYIWATCMSYEMILLIEANDPKYLEKFNSKNHALNTKLTAPLSKLYKSMPEDVIGPIENGQVFYYNHEYGLSP